MFPKYHSFFFFLPKNIEEDNFKKESENLDRIHQLSWEQLTSYQKAQFDTLTMLNQLAIDYVQNQLHPLEQKLMQERHDLQNQHLKDQQVIEVNQQTILLQNELKQQMREHK